MAAQSDHSPHKNRIQIVNATVLVLVLGLTVFTHLSAQKLIDDTTAFIADDLPRAKQIAALKLSVLAQDPLLYEYYATANAPTFHHERAINRRAIQEVIASLNKGFGSQVPMQYVVTQLAEYNQLAEQLDRTMTKRPTDWDRAREILAAASAESRRINQALDALTADIDQRVSLRSVDTQSRINGIIKLVEIFSVVLLLIAFSVGTAANAYLNEVAERRKLSMFAERNPNPVLSVAPDGTVRYVNPGARDLLSRIGDGEPEDLLPPDFLARAAAIRAGRPEMERCEYRRLDRVFGCGMHYLKDFDLFHAFISDITERHHAQEMLRHQALHDALTGLPNRRSYDRTLETLIAEERPAAIMLLNVDRFRRIVDGLGHVVADQVLRVIAQRLEAAAMTVDAGGTAVATSPTCGALPFRFEGDIFGLALPGIDSREQAIRLAEQLLPALQSPIELPERSLFVSLSTSVVMLPADGSDAVTLTRNADAVLNHLKAGGGGRVASYTPEMNASALDRLELEHGLRGAMDRAELELYFQPQADIRGGKLVGVETLLRWNHPERGQISPARFIPVAEDTGLIVPIGTWVLHAACMQGRRWLDAGLAVPVIAVNVSARQFVAGDLPQVVADALRDSGLPAAYLELEITESIAMHEVERTVAVLKDLSALGIRLSIDDFGTGYSSLAYLKRFPIHKLKIDQSFVRGMGEDENEAAIASAVVNLALALGLVTIAEGVETPAQLAVLRALGCDEIQGYLFSRPLPAVDATRFLTNARPLGTG